jgi:hypothetical protein
LFPGIITSFKGIDINLYRASRIEGQRKMNHSLTLFTVATSELCNNQKYLQIDLLQDSKELYSKTFVNSGGGNASGNQIRSNNNGILHCFLITDLQKILGDSARLRARQRKQHFLGRKCLVTMVNLVSFESHISKCSTCRPGQNIFCASKNCFFHVPMKKEMSSDSYRFVPNQLEFTTRSLYQCLKPCIIGTLDFEASSHELKPSVNTNKNMLFEQWGLAYGIAYKNLYEHLPLPPSLTKVRLGFLDDEIRTTFKSLDQEGTLILHLFETI